MSPIYSKKCQVKGCLNKPNESNVAFFHFPTNKLQLKEWVEFCNVDRLKKMKYSSLKNYLVCENHFETIQFQYMISPFNDKKKLKIGAIPKLNGPIPSAENKNELKISQDIKERFKSIDDYHLQNIKPVQSEFSGLSKEQIDDLLICDEQMDAFDDPLPRITKLLHQNEQLMNYKVTTASVKKAKCHQPEKPQDQATRDKSTGIEKAQCHQPEKPQDQATRDNSTEMVSPKQRMSSRKKTTTRTSTYTYGRGMDSDDSCYRSSINTKTKKFLKPPTGKKCLVKSCNISEGDLINGKIVEFFQFPIKPDRRKIWIDYCQNNELYSYSQSTINQLKICETHFNQSEFMHLSVGQGWGKKLIRTAVPGDSIYIGSDRPTDKQHRATKMTASEVTSILKEKQWKENAPLRKDPIVVIEQVRTIAEEEFKHEEDPDMEIVNSKEVKFCEFGTQTDFDHRPVQNNLNLFFCSLYNDNEVSTYCNLSPPTPAAPSPPPLIPRINLQNLMFKDHIKVMKTQPKKRITSQGSQTPKSLIRSIIFDEARNIVKNPANINSVRTHRNALSSLVQEEIKKIPASFVSNDYPATVLGDFNPRVVRPNHEVEKMVEKIDFEKDCREFYDSNSIEVEGEGDEKRFKCLGCCVNLTSPNELIQHVKNNHHPRNIALRCNQCPVAFPLAFQLQDHKEQIHGESRQIKCGFCNKSFSETRIYIRHVMLRHAKKTTKFTVRCQTCSVVCKNMKVYRKHQIIHMREVRNKSIKPKNVSDGFDPDEIHMCLKCNSIFKSKYALTLHNAHKHKPTHGNQCHICNKKFKYPSMLNYHMDWHKGIRNKSGTLSKKYECHLCLKNTFKSKYILHNHLLRIHKVKTDDMNYLHSCTLCGKEFVFPSMLKEHMETHHGTTVRKKHNCNICGKQLGSGPSLQNHMAVVHYPDRCKFVCAVCDRRFATKHHLMEHMNTHNEEKPHGCDECGTRFKCKGNLQHHIKSVHGVPVERVLEDGTVSIELLKIKRARVKKEAIGQIIETEIAVSHIEEHGPEMEVEEKDFYITSLAL